jgi:hypothetical protein
VTVSWHAPTRAYAKAETESRLTFITDGVGMAGVFASLKALLGGAARGDEPAREPRRRKPDASPTARHPASDNATAKAASD